MSTDNLIHADCLDAMAAMDADSIDAIVTDPPYGLEFMGKGWDGADGFRRSLNPADVERDNVFGRSSARGPEYRASPIYQQWCEAWAREALRIAKPGAHLLAFGGTRTVHRLAAAIEDAGWEIRDMLVWGYASGFPKSLDVSKAIDRAAGAEREVVGSKLGQPGYSLADNAANERRAYGRFTDAESEAAITAPATPDAEKWNGWGTALKPAWEPIVMARKPLSGTVAATVLRHGTGALNIDGTRIPTTDTYAYPNGPQGNTFTVAGGIDGTRQEPVESSPLGRWPANVILTDPIFDGGVEGVVGGGETTSGGLLNEYVRSTTPPGYALGMAKEGRLAGWDGDRDSGTYSRFFLIPKSARSEREPVLNPDGHDRTTRFTTHPTVKPLDLMRHLVRLVTPPGGTVLDPFLGSGTTALACEMEGFAWIGIEKEAEYVAITEARLNGTQQGLGL